MVPSATCEEGAGEAAWEGVLAPVVDSGVAGGCGPPFARLILGLCACMMLRVRFTAPIVHV